MNCEAYFQEQWYGYKWNSDITKSPRKITCVYIFSHWNDHRMLFFPVLHESVHSDIWPPYKRAIYLTLEYEFELYILFYMFYDIYKYILITNNTVYMIHNAAWISHPTLMYQFEW